MSLNFIKLLWTKHKFLFLNLYFVSWHRNGIPEVNTSTLANPYSRALLGILGTWFAKLDSLLCSSMVRLLSTSLSVGVETRLSMSGGKAILSGSEGEYHRQK